jgi:SH3-like domain-containing protein
MGSAELRLPRGHGPKRDFLQSTRIRDHIKKKTPSCAVKGLGMPREQASGDEAGWERAMKLWREIAGIASVTPLLAIAMHAATPASAAAREIWRITDLAPTARIHLRQQPNNRSKIVTYIPGDARGLVGGPCSGDWCQVEYDGFKGWLFARYLAPDNAPRRNAAAPASPNVQVPNVQVPNVQVLMTKKLLQLAKRGGTPLAVYAFPNEQLPIAGSLPADVEVVQGLGSCIKGFCYMRSGELVGWLKLEAFAADELAKDENTANTTNTAAIVVSPSPVEAKALNKTEPTSTQVAVQGAAAALQPLGDAGNKSYTLAGLGGQSALAMRESPDGTSRILGWIPSAATNVEGLHKCVEKWCLVRHGTVSGWVARRHLADASVESSQTFQAKGLELWGSVNVYDYPNAAANVIGKIPSYATGIVPIGGCDDEWCHVRYLGIAGWVSGQYIEPQAR